MFVWTRALPSSGSSLRIAGTGGLLDYNAADNRAKLLKREDLSTFVLSETPHMSYAHLEAGIVYTRFSRHPTYSATFYGAARKKSRPLYHPSNLLSYRRLVMRRLGGLIMFALSAAALCRGDKHDKSRPSPRASKSDDWNSSRYAIEFGRHLGHLRGKGGQHDAVLGASSRRLDIFIAFGAAAILDSTEPASDFQELAIGYATNGFRIFVSGAFST